MNPNAEQDAADGLRPEYNLDYTKARPNRFAGQVDKSQVVVMLDADISEVFTTPESVTAILRAHYDDADDSDKNRSQIIH